MFGMEVKDIRKESQEIEDIDHGAEAEKEIHDDAKKVVKSHFELSA